ncbi:hypothetical protein [Paraburkholderia youngii]|uniref:hypothetical protein n=1 Tax=Paraburkholderia youngii TaxID=2782701 RepID=UPI003D21CFB0
MNTQSTEERRPQPGRVWHVYHLTDVRSEEQQEIEHNYEKLAAERDAVKAAVIFRASSPSTECKLVARVRARSPGEVVHLTSTVDVAWWENAAVQLQFAGETCRSSGIGDIVVDDRGVGFYLSRLGWESIGPALEHKESVVYSASGAAR